MKNDLLIEEYIYLGIEYYREWIERISKKYELIHVFPSTKQIQTEGNFYDQPVLIHIFKKKKKIDSKTRSN